MASVEDPTPLSIPPCPSFTVHGNQSSGQHLAPKSDHVPVPEAPQIRPGKRPIASAIDAVLDRRAQAGRLIAGVAAASDSDMFKGPVGWLYLHSFPLGYLPLVLTTNCQSN